MIRTLGRHVDHDPRSRGFAHPEPVAGQVVQPVLWPRYSKILSQGDLGACTGNAMAGWLGTAPHCRTAEQGVRYDEAYAVALYSKATRLDNVLGHYPPTDTGSTGLAVAKAAKVLGEISSYTWAFTTSALLHALQHGPVIAGITWYQQMFEPGSAGEVRIGGDVAGGHEILIRGFQAGYLLCDNSWGTGWGVNGSFRLSLATWERLRAEQADVTIPHL